MIKKIPELSANAMKQELWTLMKGVAAGTITPAKANSAVGAARSLTKVISLEIQVARLSGKKPSELKRLL